MPKPEIIEFIEKGLQAGKHPHDLQMEGAQLFNWSEKEFNEGLNHVILAATEVLEKGHIAAEHKSIWQKLKDLF